MSQRGSCISNLCQNRHLPTAHLLPRAAHGLLFLSRKNTDRVIVAPSPPASRLNRTVSLFRRRFTEVKMSAMGEKIHAETSMLQCKSTTRRHRRGSSLRQRSASTNDDLTQKCAGPRSATISYRQNQSSKTIGRAGTACAFQLEQIMRRARQDVTR